MSGQNPSANEKDDILQSFPRLSQESKELVAAITKGKGVLLLRLRIMDLLLSYSTITVRMTYYRLVSIFSEYPNDRKFYKRLQYSLKRLRKLFPELNMKFRDPTRPVRITMVPNPRIEIWVEKSSLEFFLRRLAEKYRVPTLAERGFGSITMFTRAIARARQRGVQKILFISDHDPSGLMIDKVTKRELPVTVERIALTIDQIRRYHLPSIKVKRSDSRAKKYMQKFGDNAWEVEALPPRALLRIVEEKLIENIPKEFLEELKVRAAAERVTRPLEKQMLERIRTEAVRLKKQGLSDEDLRRRLMEKFGAEG